MTTKQKKRKIKALVVEMLKNSHKRTLKKVDAALNSGAIDAESWDEKNAPMIIPKCIVMALLEEESMQYSARGTSYERRIKKEVRNIRLLMPY